MLLVDRLIGLASPAAALRRGIRLFERGRAAAAFPLLTRLGPGRLAEAEYRIARCYLEGSGVPPSRAEGARWLETRGEPWLGRSPGIARCSLCARPCETGRIAGSPTGCSRPTRPHEPDFASALKWARKAAEAGDAKGQALLGYI